MATPSTPPPGARAISSPAKPPAARRHASWWLFLIYIAVGLLALAEATLTELPTAPAVIVAALGLFALALGAWGIVVGRAQPLLSGAFIAIQRRNYDEALELLARAKGFARFGGVRRAIAILRATIAYRRGDLGGANEALDVAIAVPISWLGAAQAAAQRDLAMGMRAVIRASRGDSAGALSDAETLRKSAHASVEALAHASLAEALVVEQRGDRAALGALLTRDAGLLFESTGPRERAIVRAFQRMLRAPASSVYRKAASEPLPSNEPGLHEWATIIAPSAARFLQKSAISTGGLIDVPAASEQAKRAVAAAHVKKAEKTSIGRILAALALVLLISVAIAGAVLAVGQSVPSALSSADPAELSSRTIVALVAAVFGVIGYSIFAARRDARRLIAASVARAKGDAAGARTAVETLSRARRPLTRASAELQLAHMAEAMGDLDASLAASERGIGAVQGRALRAVASDLLLPGLIAERAFVLAATDRGDEANAELAGLAPDYMLGPFARARVTVVRCLRANDLAGAAAAVASTPEDAQLTRRDELLFDLTRAAAGSAISVVERDRLRDELRTWPEGRSWIERITPGLCARFEATRVDEASNDADAERDAAAERDAQAEREAEAALAEETNRAPRVLGA